MNDIKAKVLQLRSALERVEKYPISENFESADIIEERYSAIAEYRTILYESDVVKFLLDNLDERDELFAEVAAYQGHNKGGIPNWIWNKWDFGWERNLDKDQDESNALIRCLYIVRDHMAYEWRLVLRRSGRSTDEERIIIGFANSPRNAMRAAENAARNINWL